MSIITTIGAASLLVATSGSSLPPDDEFFEEVSEHVDRIDDITSMADEAVEAMTDGDFRGASQIASDIAFEWTHFAIEADNLDSAAALAGRVSVAVFEVCAAAWNDASAALATLDPDHLTRAADAIGYCADGADLLIVYLDGET